MGASSVTGVGQGSCDKKGHKGSEHLFVGVEKLIGTRIVFSGKVTLSGGTASVVFPQELAGVNADYIVICNGAHNSYATSVTVNGFTANGTGTDVVSFIVVKLTNATVEVN